MPVWGLVKERSHVVLNMVSGKLWNVSHFVFSQKFVHRQSEKWCCNDGEINPLISNFQAIFTPNFTADAARLSVVVLIYNLSMQNSHNAQLL